MKTGGNNLKSSANICLFWVRNQGKSREIKENQGEINENHWKFNEKQWKSMNVQKGDVDNARSEASQRFISGAPHFLLYNVATAKSFGGAAKRK